MNKVFYFIVIFIFASCKLSQSFRTNSRCLRNLNILSADKQIEVTVTNLDNGESIKIPSGSPLSLAAVRSGMRLSFQCKQGTCQSCETMLDGYKNSPFMFQFLCRNIY